VSFVRQTLPPFLRPPATGGLIVRPPGLGGVAPGGGNGFDDDFESAGALDPALWTTYQAASVSDVTKSGGLLLYSVEDDGDNNSLWFGANQGRLDYQSPGAGPWRFEAHDAGAAVLDSPGTPLAFASNEFQLVGIIYHDPTLATPTYRGCFAGHRGSTQFTVELKNNNAGSSTTRDEGADVHAGLIDLAIEKAADGSVTFQRRTGGGAWVTCTDPSNIPAVTDDWVVGLTAYMFDGFKRDFTGRLGGWAKVS